MQSTSIGVAGSRLMGSARWISRRGTARRPYSLLYYAALWKSLKAGICLVSGRFGHCGRGREVPKDSSETQNISRTPRTTPSARPNPRGDRRAGFRPPTLWSRGSAMRQ
ncbi:hypothetical protein BDN71DRAFT_205177 [Pleurotus eryngii]|uniref:Uncharacterized protein n=1 Tax=Pleurotus eryngii TaxID=5323 RepID=A0A9P5ZLX4_PLEER|nr:hypothetical protein BDN71DRAFT_205177 [Pleurotus eryngii]